MNICRVCLNSKPRKDITHLTLQPDENADKHSYQEIIEFCLGIQVTENETISTKLCETCYKMILEFYQFKALAIKNDAHLRSLELQTVVFLDDKVKKENSEVESEYEFIFGDEPLIYVKEECKQEDLSDDELISVLKDIKDDLDNDGDLLVKGNKENVLKKPKLRERRKVKDKPETTKRTQNRVKRERKPKEKLEIKLEPKKICDICGKEVRDYKQHIKQHKPPETRPEFECEMCGKILFSKVSIKKHIRNRHINVPMKCHICGKSVKLLEQHIKLMHNRDTLPFGCIACDKRFLSKSSLEYHTTLHTKERPFECDICHKSFRGKDRLITHKRRVHDKEKPHMCQFCSKRFFKKYHLQVHIRKHTKEKPHECPECNKMFKSTNSLRNHRLLHVGDKKYHCTLCSMSFVSPKYLRTHMISHTKEKKYPCQYCDVRFHRSDHRKRHEFTAHLKHTVNKDLTVS